MDALCLLVGTFFHIPRCSPPPSSPQIITSLGPVEGTGFPAADGTAFRAFRGIPYATIIQRGQRASDHEPWKDVFQAMKEPPPCPLGTNTATKEDCLSLNFFVPMAKHNSSLPVLFFLLSEEITSAAATPPSPSLLLASSLVPQGIALVTVQYRLGPLGFLTTEDSSNNGLSDLVKALHFVAKNAVFFGGDPMKITIGGVGKGAELASALSVSPATRGYVNGLLLLSGSSWSFGGHSDQSSQFFKNLNCENNTHLSCIQKATLDEIESAAEGLSFSPSSGEDLLPLEPSSLLHSASQMPSLITLSPEVNTAISRRDFEQYIYDISRHFGGSASSAFNKISDFYLPQEEDLLDEQFAKLKADVEYRIPCVREARDRSAYSSVFVAELENSDEITLLLEQGFSPDKAILIYSIANFVRSGDPSSSSLSWPKFDSNSSHLEISDKKSKVDKGLLDEEIYFWNSLAHETGRDFFSGLRVGPLSSSPPSPAFLISFFALSLLFF